MGKEGKGEGRPASGDRSGRREERARETDGDRGRKREMGSGQGPFKRESSECAQEGLLVAAAKDIYPSSGQYRCLNLTSGPCQPLRLVLT